MSETGLDFALGEMADTIRETTRRFAADRIAPLAAKIDEEDWFPRELWPEMGALRAEEHTSELQSLMRISYAVFCLKQKIAALHNSTTGTIQESNSDNYT